MKLIVQPRDGIKPLVDAIGRARKSVAIAVFRFDLTDLEKALAAAIKRGVAVQALIAHTSGGGEKKLRKLESLFVLGFNYTALDVKKSRSLGVVTRSAAVVREARSLIAADADRSKKFRPSHSALVISPENARQRLRRFIRKARRELLIYDPGLSDDAMLQELQRRADAGVVIKIIGRVEKKWQTAGFKVRKPSQRLHVRAIVRDGRRAFIGSQSLRRLELDERREVGMMIRDRKIVKQIERVFNADWRGK